MGVLKELRRSIFILSIIAIAVVANQLFSFRHRPLALAISKSTVTPVHMSSQPKVDSASKAQAVVKPPIPDYTLPQIIDGLVPVLNRIPTSQKVVFLGIDDGVARTSEAMNLLATYHVPASLFLNDISVEPDIDYFRSLQTNGATIENHTVDHEDLTTLSYIAQKDEICNNADRFETLFSHRPTLFRPPYGNYDQTTLRAAADCGMRVLINWSAKANGGSMQYQDGYTGLVPGDIVLMHFRPEFAQDFEAYREAVTAAGLRTASLEEWLK